MKTLLTGGQVIDGTSAVAKEADVLIEGDLIRVLPAGETVSCDQKIDCQGKWVTPGFIDIHSHMDYFAIGDQLEAFDPFIAQGITTMVAGNCGFSPFGFKCSQEHHHLIENSLFKEGHGHIDWHSFEGFRNRLAKTGLAPNLVSLVGHGVCRASLHGFDASPMTQDQQAEMLSLLEQALEQGAAGISLGLQYKPGVFAKMAELKAVASLAKKHDKILSVHAKAYSKLSGTYPLLALGQAHNLRAIDDMLNLARETGVRLQFSHLLFAGEKTWETVDRALAKFDQALAEGLDVRFDLFPYPFGAGLLNSLFPEWVMAGMPGILRKRLPMLRLQAEIAVGFRAVGWDYDAIQITDAQCEEYSAFNGQTLAQIAAKVKKTPFQVMIDMMYLSDAETRVIFHKFYSQTLIEKLIQHPAAMYMTDAWPEPSGVQNSACYGAFPRFLELAHDKSLLSPEEMISRMTKQAAERFGIQDRGVIQNGAMADLLVLDQKGIKDHCQAGALDARPGGIEHVFINGKHLVANGEKQSSEAFGRFLKIAG